MELSYVNKELIKSPGKQGAKVGDNNSYKTENTRKQRKPTVGVTCQPPIIPSPTVVSPCFLVFSVV